MRRLAKPHGVAGDGPVRFEPLQPRLHGGPRGVGATAETAHVSQRSVQLYDTLAAAGLVEAVHVLRDDAAAQSGFLQPREGAVPVVGTGVVDAGPADGAARPVARAGLRLLHERAVADWIALFVACLRPAVVRNAGLGAHARTGEHHRAAPAKETHQIGQRGSGGRSHGECGW